MRGKFPLTIFLFLSICGVGREKLGSLDKGSLLGILVSKGEAWVEVKDDNGYAHRYLAPWRGMGPSSGGSFDHETIQVIGDLVVGNRVFLRWSMDGHLRVDHIELITPTWKKDLFEGYLLEIGDKWIDVQNKEEGVPWRFYLPWVGGYPQNGGGYDKSIIELLSEQKPTNPIIFEWSYVLRPRIVRLITREDLAFKPFYEIEEVPPWLGSPSRQKLKQNSNVLENLNVKSSNPFDSLQPTVVTNPFEQSSRAQITSGLNPFDSVDSKTLNPFENLNSTKSSSSQNPFDSAVNPFDSPANPLDNITNPFEANAKGKLEANENLSLQKKLNRIVVESIDFKNVSLADAMMRLVRISKEIDLEEKNNELRGVKVRIDLDGYSSDKAFPTVSANFKNKKLSEIIFSLIKNVGWNYSLKNGTVLIYFPEQKKGDVSTNPFENEEPKAGTSTNPFDSVQN